MKRLFCLFIVISLLLASCAAPAEENSTDTTADTVSEETTGEESFEESEEYSEEYIPDPFDVTLTDSSTGKTLGRIVETKYKTEDVLIADIIPTKDGYAVSGDGKGDSTAGIQKALNDCYDAGGGTVYLPEGNYAVKGKIFIPPFVTLRGDWGDPDMGEGYGTVLSVYTDSTEDYSRGKTVTEGTIMLGGSGGIVGLTFYYPRQNIRNVKPYPFAVYSDGLGANYMLSTVKNVTVINGYRGIGACCTPSGAHEQLTVENFKGTFLYCGSEVYNQADVGTWQNVTISNDYWKNAKGEGIKAAEGDALDAYTKENTVGLKLGDLEWTEFINLKISSCKMGVEILKGKRIQFAGSMMNVEILDCGVGVYLRDLDGRWGMLIAGGVIEGGIYNRALGTVKLCDVNVTGTLHGKIDQTATDSLTDYFIDAEKSYTKPMATLYTANLDKTGTADVADELQSILDKAGKTGGVVYLSAGKYRLDKPVSVPAGVELRGASSVANRDQGGMCIGTVILAYYGDDEGVDSEKDAALISLSGDNAGVNGLRIIYPENSPLSDDVNTTYTVRGTAKGVYIVNSAISSSGYGVDFRNCDGHFIKKVTTCCYYNSYVLGGKDGTLSGCLQNGTVVYRTDVSMPFLVDWPTNEGNIWNELFNPITRISNKYIILDGAENETVFNTFIYGANNMIVCRNSKAVVANVGSDNLGGAQTVCESGDLTVINAMRYNGSSYKHTGGTLKLFNRITINLKTEKTEIIMEE